MATLNMKHGVILMLALAGMLLGGCGADDGSGAPNQQDGQSGSTSAFTIQKGFLIVVNDQIVSSFEIQQDSGALYLMGQYYLPRQIETAFAFQNDKVLLGTTTGTVILEIDDIGQLDLVGSVDHARSCDPVIASGTTMYVTLSNGNDGFCGGSTYDNHLLVYDITDIDNPVLRDLEELDQPRGLALDGDHLWVCSAEGLWRFDASASWRVTGGTRFSHLDCNDIIIESSASYLTGDHGVQLIDLSGSTPLVLSSIEEGE